MKHSLPSRFGVAPRLARHGLAAVGLLALVGTLPLRAAAPLMHQFITDYLGPQTCAECHPEAQAEVMHTVHWTWEHTDAETGQQLGKNNVINNYCIAVPSNEPRCTSCHVGLGYADKTFDFSDSTKVDCLICHDTTGTYKKFPTGAGHPVYDQPMEFPAGSGNLWPPVDLEYVAQNAGKTTRATCGACHFYGGGGNAVKHGDLDASLAFPSRELDVHMGNINLNFRCSDCHSRGVEGHDMRGSRYSKAGPDNQLCEDCHTAAPHGGRGDLNFHTARVACQACHIPTFARGGYATKMTWDWTTAGQKKPDGSNLVIKNEKGEPIYDTQKGTFTWEENVVPDYVWFNGKVIYTTLDDLIDPAQIVTFNQLQGSVDDPTARIMPVKRFTGRQPYDAGNRTLAVPHLFGKDADAYWKSYDWDRALTAGMDYVGREYSGELGYVETEMFWMQNHMVAPADQALSCADCHVPRGRLDFAALGYPPERALALQTMRGFEIGGVQWTPGSTGVVLKWMGTPGNRYQVQLANTLGQWTDAPDGERLAGDVAGELTWSDPAAGSATQARFYRILREAQ
ncbi:MAG: tetrathionate reductase family octaheme c-type cytochrome [Verrucomicrobiales bacterium]|nr:tetrathionate reductase family octaheme c-type cytochrome [Verrucomicrobiales bacterium]